MRRAGALAWTATLAALAGGTAQGADGGVAPLVTAAPLPLGDVAPEPPPIPVAPAEHVALDEAVRRALARNPTVAVAMAEVDRADALVRQARSAWLPTLTGTGTYTRLENERVLNGRTIAAANQVVGGLLLTVPLVAPQGWVNDRHARDNRGVAQANSVDVRRTIAYATANAYLTVMSQHRQIRSTEAALANAKAHAEYAHTRLQGGLGHSIDDVRARQDLATVEVQLQAVYVGLARAREALGVLMGANVPVDSVKEVDLGPLPTLPAALEDAQTRRPDVTTQRARVFAADRFRHDVWAYYAPYIAAVGQPFVQAGSALQPHAGWQAALLLTLPLYDGGFRYGVAHERDALLVEARANLDATLRQAQSEVRLSFEAMLRADRALVSAREEARLAQRALELATLAYRAGATTNLEVIDAARRWRDAEGDVSQAEDVARHARLDLLSASGRFP
jgi:outer membrane protein TolC